MKLYLSGPMTGIPNYNREAFEAAAADLRARGYDVVSPVELDHNDGVDLGSEDGYDVDDEQYAQFLERDLEAMRGCHGVAFLDGWDRSGGAGIEGNWALSNGLTLWLYKPGKPLVNLPRWLFSSWSTTKRRRQDG